MKTWVSREAGGPDTLLLEEVDTPKVGRDELLVRVQAVGINYPDGLLIRDLYQVKPPRPFTPGSELCGVVEEVGEDVLRFKAGDVVLGRCGWGALAGFVSIGQERCVKIPREFPAVEAAAFLFTYATAYHALIDAAGTQRGQTVLVLGAAGGVGSAAVEIAHAIGARVIACASTQKKLDFAKVCGAADGLVYDADLQPGDGQKKLADQLKSLAPGGVNVIVDPVGGSYSEPALRCMARGGRHLVVGFTAGVPRIPTNLTLLKSCQIVGVDWRTFVREESASNERNVQALLSMWSKGEIRPQVTEVFPMSKAPEAILRLEGREVIGKVVVRMDY